MKNNLESPMNTVHVDLAARRAKCHQASNLCFRIFIRGALVITLVYLGLVYCFGERVVTAWMLIKPQLIYWRVGLMAVIVGAWPRWVNQFAKWAGLQPFERRGLRNYRWRFGILLVLIEALLAQDWLEGSLSVII